MYLFFLLPGMGVAFLQEKNTDTLISMESIHNDKLK